MIIIRHLAFKVLVSYIAVICFFSLTLPKSLPSTALITPFVLIFAALYYSAIGTFSLIRGERRQMVGGVRASRSRMLATLIAGVPTLLLVMRSIGQLGLRDIVTVVVICIVAYFYVMKFSVRISTR